MSKSISSQEFWSFSTVADNPSQDHHRGKWPEAHYYSVWFIRQQYPLEIYVLWYSHAIHILRNISPTSLSSLLLTKSNWCFLFFTDKLL